MSEEQERNSERAPWHLWVIGVIALLWNAMGAVDYIMTMTKNETYMESFTPEQLAFFYGFPSWVVAAWAIAVWGGVLGVILLLVRKGLAVWVLLASLIAMVITAIHNFLMSNGAEIMGGVGVIFTIVIFLVACGLYFYARAMQRRGILA